VKRHVKGTRCHVVIDGPQAQAEYIKYFNAVDRNDRDSADYSTSIRTNRYCIRIFCWVLDRVVNACCVVVIYCVCKVGSSRVKKWKKYQTSNTGRHDFQIDMAISLLNYGIGLDWIGDKRPDYIQEGNFIPCDCKKCFFCLKGHTNGVTHAGKKRPAAPTVQYKCGTTRRTKKCTAHRVNLGKSGMYCKMCYRMQDKSLKSGEKKKKCRKSRLGCAVCKEAVCATCWKSGYDKHQKS